MNYQLENKYMISLNDRDDGKNWSLLFVLYVTYMNYKNTILHKIHRKSLSHNLFNYLFNHHCNIFTNK